MRLGLIIAAFAALTVAAIAGWTRHASPTPVAAAVPTSSVQPVNSNNAVPCVEPNRTNETYPNNVSGAAPPAPAVHAVTPFGSNAAYGATSESSTSTYTESGNAAPPYPAPAPEYVQPPQPAREVVEYRYVPVVRGRRVVYYRRVRHHRPFSHSVAIVAGSAGAGAAIGALAGGGKGAGIGAVAGGAGGLIYDRLTH